MSRVPLSPGSQNDRMASYSLNDGAIEHARRLIEARQYVHKDVELAAHELLQLLDSRSA